MRFIHLVVLLALVTALTGCSDDSVVGFTCNAGAEVISDYGDKGTFTAATLNQDGVTVTGSNTINVLNFNGLGIVGGLSDIVLDGSESMTLAFDTGAATGVSYFVPIAGNGDSDGLVGEAFIEAFDPGGSSLGQISVSGAGEFDVSTLFSAEPIGFFTVTADADSLRIVQLTFSPCQ